MINPAPVSAVDVELKALQGSLQSEIIKRKSEYSKFNMHIFVNQIYRSNFNDKSKHACKLNLFSFINQAIDVVLSFLPVTNPNRPALR